MLAERVKQGNGKFENSISYTVSPPTHIHMNLYSEKQISLGGRLLIISMLIIQGDPTQNNWTCGNHTIST